MHSEMCYITSTFYKFVYAYFFILVETKVQKRNWFKNKQKSCLSKKLAHVNKLNIFYCINNTYSYYVT